MALSTAFASFAAAPSPAVPTLVSQVAHAKTPPGAISQTSLSPACVGIAASAAVLSSGRRGKKGASKIAMKDATYAFQKDVYADLEYLNDVGYLPDGTALNKAGNAINHPETIGADKHVAGTPLPRAKFVNSVGYLPDGTPMNAAGNAINHPERMGQDPHMAGSPLPASSYLADKGYLADGTDLTRAGNNSIKQAPVASAAFVGHSATSAPKPSPTVPGGTGTAMYGRKGDYSFQRDAYADQEFSNDVGYLPDGTPLNRAGNAINHPESIGPDRHTPGSPLPRANFMNSIGYLPDGTPLNRAGNAINHPESIQPDRHTPGAPLPASVYAADVGYLVDGTPIEAAGNKSVGTAPATPPQASVAAFVGSSAPSVAASPPTPAPTVQNTALHGRSFEYSYQRDVYADQEFSNDVGYLPDGTALNRAGNAINHPERMGPDRHNPGSPLPRANFMNSIGYLPDGTPMNRAGNNVNHPERLMPDPHTPGTPLPASCYAADAGYLVDGTPLEAAGNNSARMAPPQAPEPAFVPKPFVPPGAPISSPPPAPTPAPAPAPVSNWRNSSDCLADGTPISRAGNNINHPDRPQAPVNNSGFARRAAAEEAPPSSTYLPY